MMDELAVSERALQAPHPRGCFSDEQAVAQFLAGYESGSKHTFRAYAKETLRFLLWLRFTMPAQSAALPAVTPATIRDYMTFAGGGGTLPADYLRRSNWPKKTPPFSGTPLAAASRSHILHVLRRLFDVLGNIEAADGQAYCRFNPLRGGRAFGMSALQQTFTPGERGLSFEAWSHVKAAIAAPGRDPEQLRDRWIVMLLYLTFLRRSEAASIRMGDFSPHRAGWKLRVLGKGGATKDIVAVSALIDELVAYRVSVGLPPLPRVEEDRPAIGRLAGEGPVRPGTLYRCVRGVFDRAARIAAERGDPVSADLLRRASPHWLRHTGISHAMELGVEPRYVQAQARHSSLAITGLYDHKDRDAWASGMERLGRK